jgi:hypothetical protein
VQTDEQKRAYGREYMRKKRAEARAAGVALDSDKWQSKNKDKRAAHTRAWRERNQDYNWAAKNQDIHRANVARWRLENRDKAREIGRRSQATRRSTPWGRINNNMWSLIAGGVRRRSTKRGKYNTPLGYTWAQLAEHLEQQFTADMAWDNWGTVWEIDHIKPLSTFHYQSLDDPLFKEAWALTNLRPLHAHMNAAKGRKHLVEASA